MELPGPLADSETHKEQFLECVERLEKMGEPRVRVELDSEWSIEFIDVNERHWAQQWLRQKDHERLLRREENADRSVAAAERAAVAAEKSARFAMWSSIIALSTVAVTVLMGGFLAWLFG